MAVRTTYFFGSYSSYNPFIIQINSGADGTFTIPTAGGGYNYKVSTSDGQNFTGVTGNLTITFPDANTLYDISISGGFPRIYFNNTGDKDKLMDIKQWGDIEWTSMEVAFYGCSNTTCTATDAPNFSSVTNMSRMFQQCTSLTTLNVSNWNVSSVTTMQNMFYGCSLLEMAGDGVLDFSSPIKGSISVRNINALLGTYNNAYTARLIKELYLQCGNVTSEPAPFYGELRINYCEKVLLIDMGVSMSLRANQDTTKTSMDKQGWLDLVSSIRDMTGQSSPTVTLPNNAIFTNDNDIVNAFQAKNWTVII